MTWFEIRPQDVWLFRDGRPFSAGEDHSAHSMFPPTPLTVQGALRQKISTSLGVSLHEYRQHETDRAQRAAEYIGASEAQKTALDTGQFRMAGPFVSRHTKQGVEPLFSTPADLLRHKDTGELLITAPGLNVTSDLENDYLFPQVVQDYENMPDYWITARGLENYLGGYTPDNDNALWHNNHVYLSEGRFGVAIDAATSFREEGQLYQVEFIRPRNGIGLLVQVEGIPNIISLLEGEVTLGGEHRRASVSSVSPLGFPKLPSEVSGRFKVVFLTPAYFNAGWQPTENGDWSGLFGVPENAVQLVSAALYRPVHIGGWNGAANHPRTMHKYVASGSVYYFETTDSIQLPSALTENPDGIRDAAAIGFGQYTVGSWS